MVSGPGVEPWNYKPITVQCDLCNEIMPAEDASAHAFNHWDTL